MGRACGPDGTQAPVSQLDLAPTLAELAGVDAEEAGFEGTSLAPLLAGEAAGGPESVVAEYLAEGVRAPAVMIRRGSHKFVHCPGDPDQLYDLAADPQEVDNLAAAGQQQSLAEAMRAEAERRWDLQAIERDVLESQRQRRLVAAGLLAGAHTPWDFQPFTDASRQWVRGDAATHERPSQLRPRGELPEP